jgi:hypothetical protein
MYSIREMEEMHPGSTIDRPGTYGPFNTVVECYLDRVARSLTDFDIIETAFRERGVSIWCLHEKIRTRGDHMVSSRNNQFFNTPGQVQKKDRNSRRIFNSSIQQDQTRAQCEGTSKMQSSRADLQRMVGVSKKMCVSYNSNYRKQISPAILGIRQMCHMS